MAGRLMGKPRASSTTGSGRSAKLFSMATRVGSLSAWSPVVRLVFTNGKNMLTYGPRQYGSDFPRAHPWVDYETGIGAGYTVRAWSREMPFRSTVAAIAALSAIVWLSGRCSYTAAIVVGASDRAARLSH